MVGAAVSVDELHPPHGESLEGLDLRGVDLITDVARDHAATLPAVDRSGGADLLGAAEVELGGGGPAAEQRLARFEVAARGEGAEVHGLVAEAVQQRGYKCAVLGADLSLSGHAPFSSRALKRKHPL